MIKGPIIQNDSQLGGASGGRQGWSPDCSKTQIPVISLEWDRRMGPTVRGLITRRAPPSKNKENKNYYKIVSEFNLLQESVVKFFFPSIGNSKVSCTGCYKVSEEV